MNFKLFASLAIVASSLNAFAVDTSQCPSRMSVKASVTKVFASSIYSNVPGWKESQNLLSKNPNFSSMFGLSKKTQKSCVYVDNKNNTATLTTSTLLDPEEFNGTVDNDVVIVNFKIAASSYVTYVSMKSYGLSGVELWSNPSAQKIKTKLFSPGWNRVSDFDLGMISVEMK